MVGIKELAVVLVIALTVFRVLRPLTQRFASEADLRRRRFAWCALTAAAFLSPNVWLFVIAAILVLVVIGRKDSNPVALYLFLYYAVPPFEWRIPMIGISHLVTVTPVFLLAFFIVSFQAVRMLREPLPRESLNLEFADFCLLGYVLVTAFYFVLPEISPDVLMAYTAKDCIRRAFTLFITLYVPYFAISRSLLNSRAILDALASFMLAAAAMAAVALFEADRHWLLYLELIRRFTPHYAGHVSVEYLMRGGYVRAMASAGQPLTLAYALAIALGFWLGVRHYVDSRRTVILTLCLLLAGLYATDSTGPWVGAAFIVLVFSILSPGSTSRALRFAAVAAVAGMVLFELTGSSALASHLPFVRSMENNADYLYRVRLFDRAQQIFLASPLLGDQQALLKMQALRQGEGIIDMVNGYVDMLLGSGLVGFSLWVSFVTIGLGRARRFSREFRTRDPKLSMLGLALIACTLGTVFLIATCGMMDPMICALTGLSMAYTRACRPAGSTLPQGSIACNT
jgi:hypothetical protein